MTRATLLWTAAKPTTEKRLLTSSTGREFNSSEDAIQYVRECIDKMLDPGASMMESSHATVEMLYTVKALDEFLVRGGMLPYSWREALPPFGGHR